jgi:hypothetical protein
MATRTQPAAPFAEALYEHATTATMVVLFWAAAAGPVAAAQTYLHPLSPAAAAAATVAAIMAAAYGYTRSCARQAGITHALGVGSAWLVLGIAAEIAMESHLAHDWHAVLGSPDRPLLRNVFFFVWIFAPVLFARRDGVE